MEQVFSYIISLGASVMMPILFTIIGLCIGMNFGKSLKSGLYVGVGFVGLGIVTALLTSNFGSPLSEISRLYDLQLGVFDMGWPAAAAVAYNTAVGALIIPICLGVNFLLLITKCTRTVNIDLWNYWHFAFIGAVAYFVMDQSLAWGYFAAIVCYIITLVMADLTADRFQGYYEDMEGISIPQPFCQSFTAFAIGINWLLDKIPGFSKLDIDADGLKKKFGVLGEPIVLGVIVGALIGAVAQLDIKKILFLGVTMGAVMELIPRITRLFIDGLMPISEKTQEVVKRKFNGKKVYIGKASPAVHVIAGGWTKKHANAKAVKVAATEMTLALGTVAAITASQKLVRSDRAALEHARKLRFYSSDRNVAIVSENGRVKAVGEGRCTIHVIANNGARADISVTVVAGPTGIAFKKSGYSVKKGKKLKLADQVKLTPAGVKAACSWTSSDPSVATVNGKGDVKGVKKGTATITATTANQQTAKVKITVK